MGTLSLADYQPHPARARCLDVQTRSKVMLTKFNFNITFGGRLMAENQASAVSMLKGLAGIIQTNSPAHILLRSWEVKPVEEGGEKINESH